MKKIAFDDVLSFGVLLLLSVLSVVDLFMNTGQSANMDGTVHTMTPTLFAHSILQGNIPVSWIDHFANYGLPLGVIAQQFSTYITALIILLTHNPVLSFNLTLLLGVVLSNMFYYLFLRFYFSPFFSMIGVILFTLAPYRIMNMYIRGAMPEFFASVFMPLLLIGVYLLLEKKNISGFFLTALSIAGIILTHPFMLVVSGVYLVPYILFLLYKNNQHVRDVVFEKKNVVGVILLGVAGLLGLGIASYYFLPLTREIKYFYYGLHGNHLTAGNYLSLANFFGREWYYITSGDTLARGFFVSVGNIESLSLILAICYLTWKWRKPSGRTITIFEYALIVSLIYVFFLIKLSDPLYQHINLLSNIQFPWRMLSGFIIVQPILLVFMLERLNRKWIGILLVLVVVFLRFPQLYGKNYTLFPDSHYEFTNYNLHATVMNPIWSGRSEDYPVKKQKGVILEGKGTITPIRVTDTLHSYHFQAKTPLHVVDYTFYFPGWNLYLDNQKGTIEYQDPLYRGVITYHVPQGVHTIDLRFEDTTIRKIGKIISIASLVFFFFLLLGRRKLQQFFLS